jgi:hypothetical protein
LPAFSLLLLVLITHAARYVPAIIDPAKNAVPDPGAVALAPE